MLSDSAPQKPTTSHGHGGWPSTLGGRWLEVEGAKGLPGCRALGPMLSLHLGSAAGERPGLAGRQGQESNMKTQICSLIHLDSRGAKRKRSAKAANTAASSDPEGAGPGPESLTAPVHQSAAPWLLWSWCLTVMQTRVSVFTLTCSRIHSRSSSSILVPWAITATCCHTLEKLWPHCCFIILSWKIQPSASPAVTPRWRQWVGKTQNPTIGFTLNLWLLTPLGLSSSPRVVLHSPCPHAPSSPNARCLSASLQISDTFYPIPILSWWPCVEPHLEKRRAIAPDPYHRGLPATLIWVPTQPAPLWGEIRQPRLTSPLTHWVPSPLGGFQSLPPSSLTWLIFSFPMDFLSFPRCCYFSYFRKNPTSLWSHNPSCCPFILKLFGRDAYSGCLPCLSGTHFDLWPLLKFVFSKLPITSAWSILSFHLTSSDKWSFLHSPAYSASPPRTSWASQA